MRHVALQTARFRLRDVEADVLKILYESLVDPEQRHDLGEYYTPDWLAARIIAAAVDSPLTAARAGPGLRLRHVPVPCGAPAELPPGGGGMVRAAHPGSVRGKGARPGSCIRSR